jgi:hypothetical protein
MVVGGNYQTWDLKRMSTTPDLATTGSFGKPWRPKKTLDLGKELIRELNLPSGNQRRRQTINYKKASGIHKAVSEQESLQTSSVNTSARTFV